jgi:hypothetical protein
LPTFQDDLNSVKSHTDIRLLSDGKGREVAVAPLLQGRVLTSTFEGAAGLSHGWVNREYIASGNLRPNFNPYGGEDRFWLGPEGGQFGLFFASGASFDLQHAYVPSPFDREPFEVAEQTTASIRLRKHASLKNYSGFVFEAGVEREIRLLKNEEAEIWEKGLKGIAFESVNTLINRGPVAWRPETGLLSIWILGMYQPSPRATIVIPFLEGTEEALGPPVNDSYFGKLTENRLKVGSNVLFFKGDGQFRSKIGVSPLRAKPVLGAWDAENEVLTLVKYTLPQSAGKYVNSMWEIQKNPFAGDVVNSYNDGPPTPGQKPEGPFFELETSSPAAALGPGQSLTHRHQTLHLKGERKLLDQVARTWLNTSLAEVEGALSVR